LPFLKVPLRHGIAILPLEVNCLERSTTAKRPLLIDCNIAARVDCSALYSCSVRSAIVAIVPAPAPYRPGFADDAPLRLASELIEAGASKEDLESISTATDLADARDLISQKLYAERADQILAAGAWIGGGVACRRRLKTDPPSPVEI
jgi:hypothetical protein